MNASQKFGVIALSMLLGACASVPAGPSVMALPGSGKSFERFDIDNQSCKRHANGEIDGSNAARTQTDSAAKSAAIGTAVGAVAGAAIDGHSGAGAGAGIGLLLGTLGGLSLTHSAGDSLQQRYDNAYIQCMYAKGNQVPMSAGFHLLRPSYYVTAPSGNGTAPPPGYVRKP